MQCVAAAQPEHMAVPLHGRRASDVHGLGQVQTLAAV